MSAVPLERPDASLREAFYRRIDSVNMTPLWEVLGIPISWARSRP